MAITYPRDIPSYGDVALIKPKMVTAVIATDMSFSLAQQVVKHAGQRWEVEVALVPMGITGASVWTAWFASMNGREQLFLLRLKALPGTVGGASSSANPVVNGSSQTGAALIIDGAPVSETDYLKAGDFIQLGTSSTSRAHMVLEDVSTDGSGNATLNLWPEIITTNSPADGATVTVNNAKATFRLDSNITEYSIDPAGQHRQIRFKAIGVV